MVFLDRRGCTDRDHLITARVERLRHPLDRAALARGIPAFECEDERDALLIKPVFCLSNLLRILLT